MGLSRNKVAVPEGAAGSPPFYGEYSPWSWAVRTPRPGWSRFVGDAGVETTIDDVVWACFWVPGPPPHACRGAVLPFRRASGLVPVGFRAVGAWWFENWIVDASNSHMFVGFVLHVSLELYFL